MMMAIYIKATHKTATTITQKMYYLFPTSRHNQNDVNLMSL